MHTSSYTPIHNIHTTYKNTHRHIHNPHTHRHTKTQKLHTPSHSQTSVYTHTHLLQHTDTHTHLHTHIPHTNIPHIHTSMHTPTHTHTHTSSLSEVTLRRPSPFLLHRFGPTRGQRKQPPLTSFEEDPISNLPVPTGNFHLDSVLLADHPALPTPAPTLLGVGVSSESH